ncbi:TRAP transporter, DctQ-like membrane protein [Selenomonas sp. FOBRC6]|jgi:TRAP-T family tripartite ATP-independent periplasmic transporter, membrane protein|uniref:TRAP transporter small permease n=1 Tax=Selenomonas sp. FOBRC6 TaxID=936572 RepID=UPI0002782920|nr:TRAP transporter small permease [Selenomonas sp. FOBRC6]EJO21183.1 TRAP transporter, DctQ-like membrane protein [Selenomonas sp. FOBRC6]
MTGILKKTETLIALLASAAMGGIVLLVFANVIMRYCFNTGLTWSDEASVNLFVWFIFLGGILAALDGLHLKVDVLTSRLSAGGQKCCDLIANGLVLLAMGILLVGGIEQVAVSSNNISSATGIPFSYITVSMVVFAVSMILLTLYRITQILRPNEEGRS